MSKKNVKKQTPETSTNSDLQELLNTVPQGGFIRLSQKDHDLKRVRRTIKRLQKKNLTSVKYAVGGMRGDRSLYIFSEKSEGSTSEG